MTGVWSRANIGHGGNTSLVQKPEEALKRVVRVAYRVDNPILAHAALPVRRMYDVILIKEHIVDHGVTALRMVGFGRPPRPGQADTDVSISAAAPQFAQAIQAVAPKDISKNFT